MTTNLKECFRCNLLYACPSQQTASKPHKNPTNTGKITKNLIISPPYAHKNLGSTLRTEEINLYDVYQHPYKPTQK
jgi:hypothetical protein